MVVFVCIVCLYAGYRLGRLLERGDAQAKADMERAWREKDQ